jgi:DMSO reductase anchor subunit
MHPAYSVILFTTASGAGYGLLVWLAVAALGWSAAGDRNFGLVAFAVAFGLVTLGLLSSTLHLGRPMRAWRAFSQWRTSWLSREGVLAMATFVPAGLLALLWVFADGGPTLLRSTLALATIGGAVVTVWCTGMIYQSLPTIRAWHHPLVSPIYLLLALASGAALLHVLTRSFGDGGTWAGLLAVGLLLSAGALKVHYWRTIDNADRHYTAEAATGLGRFGTVRQIEPPHTQSNFVMREMGYTVARRHADRLRRLVLAVGFALPALLLALALPGDGLLASLARWVAIGAMAVGLIVERWLFFAQAQHVVTLFYGADRA